MDIEQMGIGQALFENACGRLQRRIDAMPEAERDSYVEGIADTIGAFVWETL